MSEQRTNASMPSFLTSGHMSKIEWSNTPLGAVDEWECGLLTSASVCLNGSAPAILCWGPQMTAIHNAAFQKTFPDLIGALGKSMQLACPEVWAAHGATLRREVLGEEDPAPGDNLNASGRDAAIPHLAVQGRFTYTPIFQGRKAAGGVFVLNPEATTPEVAQGNAIFQNLFDAILAPMAVVNMRRQYVQVNEAYTRLTGYKLKDLKQKTLFDVTHPDDAAPNLELLRQLETGQISSFIFEKRLQKKDGAWIWIKTNMTLVTDEAGKPLQIVALIEDIDHARETEKALKATDLEFKQILDSIPHIAWTARPDGYLDYYNRRWYTYSGFDEGYSEAAPVEKGYNEQKWTTILHPDDVERCFSTWAESIRTGLPYDIEYRFVDPKNPGGYRWFLGKALPIKDEAGRVVKWFGTCTDIDDLKHIEQTARENEERFRRLAEDAPIFVWIRNASGDLEYINQQYIDYIGFNPLPAHPNYINAFQAELLHPADLERVRSVSEKAYSTQSAFSIEARLKEKKTDLYNWFLLKSTPRWTEGEFAGFIGTGININPQKVNTLELEQRVADRTTELQEANRQLERSNKELEQFAYTASHDLQEPLRKIMTFGDILNMRGQNLSERDKQLVQKIIAASERMSTLIQDILRFSGTARHKEASKPVDLNVVVQHIVEDLEIMVNQKKAIIAYDNLPTLTAIPIQMNQLFYNLIGNALKFAKKDVPPVVEIHCRKLPTEESAQDALLVAGLDYVEITVSDNGIGFQKEYADKIFEMFQRLHERSAYTGTGIGLALCRKIVENHKGVISAQSTPGHGSVFTVLLPENLQ